MFNTQLYHVMVVLSILMLCSTHNCIMWWLFYPSLCYIPHTTVSCDGCSIHHYALFNTQLYHVMVVQSIIKLCSTHTCIMWWLFYSSLCSVQHTTVWLFYPQYITILWWLFYPQHTTVSWDGCSIHHAMFNKQLYHAMVVLYIIMLFSTHNYIMWWLFYPSLCYFQLTTVSCDGCSIHHYALFNTHLYHVMVVQSIIMLCSTHKCMVVLPSTYNYPVMVVLSSTHNYHEMVVLSIIMLCSTHNCIMWWLFYPSLCYVRHTTVSCDGCSIHHYAMFHTQL